MSVLKALDESVVIEVKARRVGEEVKVGSIIIGKEQTGEIPTHGTVIAIGPMTHGISVGDIVLLPNGRSSHVVDPRVVDGTLDSKDPEVRQLIATHWKNIQVNYGTKNA